MGTSFIHFTLIFGNLRIRKGKGMPIITSKTWLKNTQITKSPKNSHKITDSGDSHITTHIRYFQ